MNYADLFRVTLPETALELAALLVLVVDLGLLRKASLKVRSVVAALLGVAGCGAAMWAVGEQTGFGLYVGDNLTLANGGTAAIAQMGILALSALTLLHEWARAVVVEQLYRAAKISRNEPYHH